MTRSKSVRGRATLAFVGSATTIALVLGFPLSASAYSWIQYVDAWTLQNQTLSSSTTSMNGGRAVQPNGGTEPRITQVGIGSNQSTGGLAELTHATTTTYSYCQWRSTTYNWGSEKFILKCDYRR